MDKRPIGYIPGKGNPLDQKTQKNPKFQHIGPTLNTGFTVKDIQVISEQQIAKRKNQHFQRIKGSTLAQLLQQETNTESIYQIKGENEKQEYKYDPQQSYDTHSMYSFKSGNSKISEANSTISAVTYATQKLGINDNTQFLLLDLREPEDFQLFHIQQAKNFPAPNILREKWISQMLRFKNAENQMIIIYHYDERTSIPEATKFFEKGFDNCFLISGGVEQFVSDFPQFCEGKRIPAIPKKEEKNVIVQRSNYKEQPINSDFQVIQESKEISERGAYKYDNTSQMTSNLSQRPPTDTGSKRSGASSYRPLTLAAQSILAPQKI